MRMKLTISAAFVAGASLLLFGCGSEQDKMAGRSEANGDVAASAPAKMEMMKKSMQVAKSPSGAAGGSTGKVADLVGYEKSKDDNASTSTESKPASPYKQTKLAAIQDSEPDRYLIKNATVTVESRDVKVSTSKIIEAAKKVKGYVSDMHESVEATGERNVTVQLRVPFQEFEAFLVQFDGLGKVLDKKVNAQDVTEEFVDTQSKLHNLKATESRLLTHLGKTGSLRDTLTIETELNRVREGSDQIEGRIRFLSHRIAFSTMDITIRETAQTRTVVPASTFSTGKVATDATRSMIEFMQGVWAFVIVLAVWAVVWLPPVLLGWFLFKRLSRPKRPNPPTPLPYPQER